MNLQEQSQQHTFFIKDTHVVLIIFIVMLSERLLYTAWDQAQLWVANSDSINYFDSGLYYAKTGTICYPPGTPTALIMPGITVVIGLMSRFIQSEQTLILALRILWMIVGSITPIFIYRSVRLFTPPVCNHCFGHISSSMVCTS